MRSTRQYKVETRGQDEELSPQYRGLYIHTSKGEWVSNHMRKWSHIGVERNCGESHVGTKWNGRSKKWNVPEHNGTLLD